MAGILIIDDDVHIRTILRKTLQSEGYQVVEASNGNEGVRLYREKPVELIITDLIMPEKEGIETIMELGRDFPDVKIIAMSGGDKSNRSHILSAPKDWVPCVHSPSLSAARNY